MVFIGIDSGDVIGWQRVRGNDRSPQTVFQLFDGKLMLSASHCPIEKGNHRHQLHQTHHRKEDPIHGAEIPQLFASGQGHRNENVGKHQLVPALQECIYPYRCNRRLHQRDNDPEENSPDAAAVDTGGLLHLGVVVGDVAVTPMPDASQLAQIAVCTAQTAKSVAGFADPKVAMLSFSTKGSAKHEVVDKVVEATRLAKELDPSVKIEGELQADAALVPSVGQKKAPGSEIAGHANVLVFPCLEVGNIAYKLVQRLGNADAIGPILQGIARPVNDLSRGCSVDDIYKMVAITACQAMDAK